MADKVRESEVPWQFCRSSMRRAKEDLERPVSVLAGKCLTRVSSNDIEENVLVQQTR
jgi:hypothetical protein